MAINLQKGQTIDLRKNSSASGGAVADFDLSQVTIGLGQSSYPYFKN